MLVTKVYFTIFDRTQYDIRNFLQNTKLGESKWSKKLNNENTLHEKRPYSEFFRSDLLLKSPYSVRTWENTEQKNSKYGQYSRGHTIHNFRKFFMYDQLGKVILNAF